MHVTSICILPLVLILLHYPGGDFAITASSHCFSNDISIRGYLRSFRDYFYFVPVVLLLWFCHQGVTVCVENYVHGTYDNLNVDLFIATNCWVDYIKFFGCPNEKFVQVSYYKKNSEYAGSHY